MLSTFLLGLTFLFIQINEYVHIGFAPHDFAQGSVFYGLTGLHGAHVFIGLMLLAMVTVRAFRGHFSPESHRGVEMPGHLLALRRRRCGSSSTSASTSSSAPLQLHRREPQAMLNPLRSEGEAFRFLLWLIAIVVTIALIVLAVRAIT